MSFWAAGLPMGVIGQRPKYENDSPEHGLCQMFPNEEKSHTEA